MNEIAIPPYYVGHTGPYVAQYRRLSNNECLGRKSLNPPSYCRPLFQDVEYPSFHTA